MGRNGVLGVDVAGKANFAAGPMASKSPIDTDVKLSYNVKKTDLVGTFKKVMAGKEYSITFPAGSFKIRASRLEHRHPTLISSVQMKRTNPTLLSAVMSI